MVCYLCDVCGETFPGAQPGAQSIIDGDGRTAHVCSGACHRAFANRDDRARRRLIRRARLIRTIREVPDLWVAIAAMAILLTAALTR